MSDDPEFNVKYARLKSDRTEDSSNQIDQEDPESWSQNYKWYVLFTLCLVNVSNQINRYAIIVVSKSMQEDQGWGDGDGTGVEYDILLGPAFVFFFTASSIPMALIGDQMPKRYFLVFLIIGWSLVTLGMGATNSYWQVVLGMMGIAIFESACMPVCSSILAEYFDSKQMGTAMSMYNLGIYIGYSAVLGIGNYEATIISWRWIYYQAAMFGCGLALLVFLTIFLPKKEDLFLKGGQDLRRQTLTVAKHDLDFILAFEKQIIKTQRKVKNIFDDGSVLFDGKMAIDVMIQMKKSRISDREDGIICGNRLLRTGLIQSIPEDSDFVDLENALYCIPSPVPPTGFLAIGDYIYTTDKTRAKVDYDVVRTLRKGVIVDDRKWGYRNFPQCFVGSEAIDFMVSNGLSRTRTEAAVLGNKVMDAGYIRHVTDHHIFKDSSFFYKFTDPFSHEVSFRNSITFMFCHKSFLILMIAAGLRFGAGYVWAQYSTLYYENELNQSKEQVALYMSWVPLVGGILGGVIGGLVSDFIAKQYSSKIWPRLMVVVVSCFLSTPFAIGAMLLSPPFCYISCMVKYCFAEMWFGVLLAVIVETVPREICSTAVAMFYFVMANMGGLIPIVNGFLQNELGSLTDSLMILFPGLYATSGILFIVGMISLRNKEDIEAVLTGTDKTSVLLN